MCGHPRTRLQCGLHRAGRWLVDRPIPTGDRLGDRHRGDGRPKKGERASRGVNGRSARSSRTSDCPKHGENLMTEPMEVSTNASGRRVANGSYRKEVRPAVVSSAAHLAPDFPSTQKVYAIVGPDGSGK